MAGCDSIGSTIRNILKDGGILAGGFVRDYLIRGEDFADIDFYFFLNEEITSIPDKYTQWKRLAPNFEGGTQTFSHTKGDIPIHCMVQRLPYYRDLSCNRFGFDGEKLLLLPSISAFCPLMSWGMIFKKMFVRCELLTTRPVIKMIQKNWMPMGICIDVKDCVSGPEITGPWSNYKQALERFDKFMEES